MDDPRLLERWAASCGDGIDLSTCSASLSLMPAASSPLALAPGTRLDDFVIEGLLAHGGMGSIYRATQEAFARPVAIKLAHHLQPALVDRFRTEATLLGRLDHPAIVPAFHARLSGDQPYLAMRLVAGETWQQVLDAAGPLDARSPAFDRQLEIVLRCCEALGHVHNKGVIHRDIKPLNVMVGPHDEVQVMDWGLAAALPDRPALVAELPVADERLPPSGTPAYMPPEQARGERQDQRVDVYALAACLVQVLLGQPPPRPAQGAAAIQAAATATRPSLPPSVPPGLRCILEQALEPQPAERTASVERLRGQLIDWRRERDAEGLLLQATARSSDSLADLEAVRGLCNQALQLHGESPALRAGVGRLMVELAGRALDAGRLADARRCQEAAQAAGLDDAALDARLAAAEAHRRRQERRRGWRPAAVVSLLLALLVTGIWWWQRAAAAERRALVLAEGQRLLVAETTGDAVSLAQRLTVLVTQAPGLVPVLIEALDAPSTVTRMAAVTALGHAPAERRQQAIEALAARAAACTVADNESMQLVISLQRLDPQRARVILDGLILLLDESQVDRWRPLLEALDVQTLGEAAGDGLASLEARLIAALEAAPGRQQVRLQLLRLLRGGNRIVDHLRWSQPALDDPAICYEAFLMALQEGNLARAERLSAELSAKAPERVERRLAATMLQAQRQGPATVVGTVAALYRQHPQDQRVRIMRLSMLMAQGQQDAALDEARALAAADPLDSQARALICLILAERGDWAALLDQADELIARGPERQEGWLFRAEAALRLGRHQEAYDAAVTAADCGDDDLHAHFLQALAACRLQHPSGPADLWAVLDRQFDRCQTAIVGLGLPVGYHHIPAADLGLLRDEWPAAMAADASLGRALIDYCIDTSQPTRKPSLVGLIHGFMVAAQAMPGDRRPLRYVTRMWMQTGRYAVAAQTLAQCAGDDDEHAYLDGVIRAGWQDPEGGLQALLAIPPSASSYVDAQSHAGAVLMNRLDLDGARAAMDRSLDRLPLPSIMATNNRCVIACIDGDWPLAARLAEEGMAISALHPHPALFRAWVAVQRGDADAERWIQVAADRVANCTAAFGGKAAVVELDLALVRLAHAGQFADPEARAAFAQQRRRVLSTPAIDAAWARINPFLRAYDAAAP